MTKIQTNTPLMLLCAAALLSACSGPLFMGAGGVYAQRLIEGEDVNLMGKSYAAADYLEQNIRSFIKPSDTIKALPLYTPPVPLQDGEADLTTLLPFQIGSRLRQLGYTVDMSQVNDANSAAEVVMQPEQKIRYILSGSYQHQPQRLALDLYRDIDVSVSITDTKTGRVISSFDYVIPSNRQISRMSNHPVKKEESAKAQSDMYTPAPVDRLERTQPAPEAVQVVKPPVAGPVPLAPAQ